MGSRGLHYRAQAVAVPGGTLVTAVVARPRPQATLASLTHVELIVSIVVILALVVLVAVDRPVRACAHSTT